MGIRDMASSFPGKGSDWISGKKKFRTGRAIKDRDGLPREALESPFLEEFKHQETWNSTAFFSGIWLKPGFDEFQGLFQPEFGNEGTIPTPPDGKNSLSSEGSYPKDRKSVV